MTSPAPGFVQYPVTTVPTGVWQGTPNAGQIFFINQDEVDSITLSNQSTITPFGPNGAVIPPLGTLALPGTSTIYAVAVEAVAKPLMVIPGGGDWSPSPTAVAEALVASGMAAEIAQAIAATGVPLLGGVTALYQTQGAQTGAGLVGGTEFSAGNDYPLAVTLDTYVNRPMFINSRKQYYGSPTPPVTQLPDTSYINWITTPNNCQFYLCFQPDYSGVTATMQTDYNNMKATINFWIGQGLQKFKVVFWQEGNDRQVHPNFPTAAEYIALHQFYYPKFKADFPTHNVAINLSLGASDGENQSFADYWPLVGSTLYGDEAVGDGYANTFTIKGLNFSAFEALADAQAVPFGIAEFGVTNNAGQVPSGNQGSNFTEADVLTYYEYLTNLMTARLTAGKVNSDMMYYQAGPNGIQANQITGPNDYQVPTLQNMYDALQQGQSEFITLGAGASTFMTPLNPSPGGGFATANQVSYDTVVTLIAGASSTIPFAQVATRWVDIDQQGAPLSEEESWILPMSTSTKPGTLIRGKGPQAHQFLALNVKNLDTVPCQVAVRLNGTGRVVQNKHDWYWDPASSVSVPGYSLTNNPVFNNVLGIIPSTVLAASGGSISVLCAVWTGMAYLRAHTGTSAAVNIQLTPQPPSQYGVDLVSESPGNQEYFTTLILPRCACLLTMTNNDTAAHTVSAILVKQDNG